MSVNLFFNNYRFHGEQQLYEDLIVENIKIHGDDMYYIPRVIVDKDDVLGEDALSQYNKAYLIELYLKSYDGFAGDGQFVSKFGLEIREQVTFTVAKRRFDEEIGTPENIVRPREGDLIYFPLNRKVFEIRFVDNKPFFYPFGELFTYDLQCELFEYSSEEFNTGIEDIDRIQAISQDMYDWAVLDDEGNAILGDDSMPILMDSYDPETVDPIDDSADLQTEGDTLIDFSVADPYSEDGTF